MTFTEFRGLLKDRYSLTIIEAGITAKDMLPEIKGMSVIEVENYLDHLERIVD